MTRLSDVWMDTFDRAKVEEIPTYSWSPQGTVTLSANCCDNGTVSSLCSSMDAVNTIDTISIGGNEFKISASVSQIETLQDRLEELAGAFKRLEARFDEKYGDIPKKEIQNRLITGGMSRLTRSGLKLI